MNRLRVQPGSSPGTSRPPEQPVRLTGWVLLLVAVALVGCKSEPPPATLEPVADAAPPVVDARVDAVVDAAIDATTDAQLLTGSTTIIKLPPPPSGGTKNPAPAAPPARAPGQVSIMGTIRRHQNEVIDCYAKVANSKPGVAGQLTLRWTLGANGKPTMAAVARNTLGDASVGRCVKDRSMKWQFPKPAGGTSVVKYTWNLALQ